MFTREKAHDIFERIRKLATSDVEVMLATTSFSLTRFANNGIHQNVSDSGVSISIRTAFDGKTARATTNKTDDESLRRTLAAAEQLTRVQAEDSEMLPMPNDTAAIPEAPS